jgi:asparagine N-glycosylation enzyme membrane subunit Stt3
MTKRNIIIWLSAIGIVAIIIRVVYPFSTVFGMGYVNYIETDAWNTMKYANTITAMPLWDGFYYSIQHSYLFSWIIAMLGHIMPIEVAGALLPPVLSLGVIVTIFYIARNIFNDYVGIMAALFVAIMPSEFLSRSLLGFTDHHVLEVLTLCMVIYFTIKAIQVGQLRSKWVILDGVSIFLYCANWNTGLYLIFGILLVFSIGYLIQNLKKDHAHSLMPVIYAFAIGLIIYLPLGGYERLLFLFPSHEAAVASQTTGEILDTAFTSTNARTISELMPLFFPNGQFSLIVVVTNLHLFAISFIVGFIFLWRYRTNKYIVLLAVVTFITMVMAIEYRRFLYYFTVPLAIISALAVYELSKYIKGKPSFNMAILAIPLVLASLFLAKNVASVQPYSMSPDWHSALVWLKDQPGDGPVSAWVDYGHWIEYVTDKRASYLPGPGGNLMASLLLSENDTDSQKYLNKMETEYLIVDVSTLAQKVPALEIYAGKSTFNKNKAFGYKLYLSGLTPDWLKLEYENASLKIYKYQVGAE